MFHLYLPFLSITDPSDVSPGEGQHKVTAPSQPQAQPPVQHKPVQPAQVSQSVTETVDN